MAVPPDHTDASAGGGGGTSDATVAFTAVDDVVHALDSTIAPWTIQLELGLSGRLDEGRLRAALAVAMARHPMSRARQLPAGAGDRTWRWGITSEAELDAVRVEQCRDDCQLGRIREQLYGRPVPLIESPPFRLRLARGAATDTLLLGANHAAFDGLGCLRLLDSVGRAYSGRPDPEPAIGLDDARDVPRHLAAPDLRTRLRRVALLGAKLTDLARPPARIARDGGTDLPGYGFHHEVLSAESSDRLRAGSSWTLNDRLVAATHLAIASWNHEHGRQTGRISVLVPVNLRPAGWRKDVVTNMVLDARVTTTDAQRGDLGAVIRTVAAQADGIKRGGGAALIEVLGGWHAAPGWAKRGLSPVLRATGSRLVDTAVVSNLGVVDAPPDFGDVAAVSLWFSAPARLPCGLSIGAATVGDRLHLVFRHRHPQWDAQGAQRFARRLLAELGRVAEATS